MKIALSMPYLFTDHFSPDSIKEDSGKKFLQDHAGTSRKLASPIQELDLRITSEGPDTVFFATTPSRPQTVMYYMKAKRRKLEWSVVHPLNRYTRAAFQAEVWRHNTLAGSMPILTSRIFFKYLLSSTRLVVSDNQHSESGRMFWVQQIKTALRAGFGVWVLFADGKDSLEVKAVSKITSPEQIDKYYSAGDQTKGLFFRFAISK